MLRIMQLPNGLVYSLACRANEILELASTCSFTHAQHLCSQEQEYFSSRHMQLRCTDPHISLYTASTKELIDVRRLFTLQGRIS